jgi:hypothetical protein
MDEIFTALDQNKMDLVVLLDMSSVFDTIDHTILISKLQSLGITDQAMEWCRTYLSERRQTVVVQTSRSQPEMLSYGVPQGSVMGPLLFSIYMIGIGHVIAKFDGISYRIYADDIQLCLTFSPKQLEGAIRKLNACIAEIQKWLSSNFLSMNERKSDVLLVGSTSNLKKYADVCSITIGNVKLSPQQVVRNLGVQLDRSLKMDKFIQQMCRRAYANLKLVGRIWRCLNMKTRRQAVETLVLSQLNFGLILLGGVAECRLKCLQSVLNASARLINGMSRRQSITQILQSYGWLPISLRVRYRILCMVYLILSGKAPGYLKDCVRVAESSDYGLRSNGELLLHVRRTRSKVGDRSFSVLGPRLWNELPEDIRNSKTYSLFCGKLKNYLMRVWLHDEV